MDKLTFDIGTAFGSPFGVSGGKGLADIAGIAISVSYALAGVLIMFLLVLGGFKIIAGAGSDNPQEVAKGKQAVTWAVIGFIIVFVAYWIIRLIEVVTGQNFTTDPGI